MPSFTAASPHTRANRYRQLAAALHQRALDRFNEGHIRRGARCVRASRRAEAAARRILETTIEANR